MINEGCWPRGKSGHGPKGKSGRRCQRAKGRRECPRAKGPGKFPWSKVPTQPGTWLITWPGTWPGTCGSDRVAVAVWRWPCGGHMTCHVTWQDNPLRVTHTHTPTILIVQLCYYVTYNWLTPSVHRVNTGPMQSQRRIYAAATQDLLRAVTVLRP